MTETAKPMSGLERGTIQRAHIRTRVSDIALTALCLVLALWVTFGAIGVARDIVNAWAFTCVGAILFAGAMWMRASALREKGRGRI
ncbi:hypothetical protein [Streptomyces sp. A5-4]|uniref:hypothetical protein n=1 Tax=Streptomyces sp. A5-4 TaxID=3384771 RepID=UPI003DAA1890